MQQRDVWSEERKKKNCSCFLVLGVIQYGHKFTEAYSLAVFAIVVHGRKTKIVLRLQQEHCVEREKQDTPSMLPCHPKQEYLKQKDGQQREQKGGFV